MRQLSSAACSHQYILLQPQAYSNGASGPQTDTSEAMSQKPLSSFRSISQVSDTRQKGDEHTVHMESLSLPTLTTCSRLRLAFPLYLTSLSPWPSEVSFSHQGRPLVRLQTADSGHCLTSTRKGLSLETLPALPSSSPTVLPVLSWLSPCPQKHSTASPSSNHPWVVPALPHAAPLTCIQDSSLCLQPRL